MNHPDQELLLRKFVIKFAKERQLTYRVDLKGVHVKKDKLNQIIQSLNNFRGGDDPRNSRPAILLRHKARSLW